MDKIGRPAQRCRISPALPNQPSAAESAWRWARLPILSTVRSELKNVNFETFKDKKDECDHCCEENLGTILT